MKTYVFTQRTTRTPILYVTFVLVAFISAAALAVETSLKVPEEALTAWSNLQKEYRKGLMATVCYSSVEGTSEKETHTAKISLLEKFELNICTYQGIILQARNERYSFAITHEEKDDSKWLLRDISNNSEKRIKDDNDRVFFASDSLFSGIRVVEEWIFDIVNTSSFRVTAITNHQSNNENQDLCEIKFKCNYVTHDGGIITGGTLTCAPENYWVINSYDVDLLHKSYDSLNTAKIQATLDFQDIDSIPFPETLNETYEIEGSEPYSITYKISDVRRDKPEKPIFYLSHYGFSEPSFSQSAGATLRWFMILVGVPLISIGIYLKLRAAKMTNLNVKK